MGRVGRKPLDRLGQGGDPVCVATCPGEALRYGYLDELALAGPKLEGKTQPSLVIGPGTGGIGPQEYLAAFFSR